MRACPILPRADHPILLKGTFLVEQFSGEATCPGRVVEGVVMAASTYGWDAGEKCWEMVAECTYLCLGACEECWYGISLERFPLLEYCLSSECMPFIKRFPFLVHFLFPCSGLHGDLADLCGSHSLPGSPLQSAPAPAGGGAGSPEAAQPGGAAGGGRGKHGASCLDICSRTRR